MIGVKTLRTTKQRLDQFLIARNSNYQESTRICPGCKVERDFVDNVNGFKTTCKTCRGTWDAFDEMFAVVDPATV